MKAGDEGGAEHSSYVKVPPSIPRMWKWSEAASTVTHHPAFFAPGMNKWSHHAWEEWPVTEKKTIWAADQEEMRCSGMKFRYLSGDKEVSLIQTKTFAETCWMQCHCRCSGYSCEQTHALPPALNYPATPPPCGVYSLPGETTNKMSLVQYIIWLVVINVWKIKKKVGYGG